MRPGMAAMARVRSKGNAGAAWLVGREDGRQQSEFHEVGARWWVRWGEPETACAIR